MAVLHIAFSSRDILGLPGIDQEDLKTAPFQNLEYGNPVYSGGFHSDAFDSASGKPIGHGFQIAREGSKRAHRFVRPAGGDARIMFPGTHIDPRGMGVDEFPTFLQDDFPLFFFCLSGFLFHWGIAVSAQEWHEKLQSFKQDNDAGFPEPAPLH